MATVTEARTASSTSTLPRLLAINKSFADLDTQIDQATHIIGLPENWETLQEENERSESIQRLTRARCEWVLRWILDKLKDETESGADARTNPRTWVLLDWMVEVIPTSRSASYLRDADFVTILERTLQENFETTEVIQSERDGGDATPMDLSESSETVCEGPRPSRKRKRPSSGNITPSKKVTLETLTLGRLFGAFSKVVRAIIERASSHGASEGAVHTEQMRMVLRTESAQAARVLKYWLIAVHGLFISQSTARHNSYLDLSSVLEIWDLRIIEAGDSGASAEQFSTECFIPTLLLHDQMRSEDSNAAESGQNTMHSLERLLARHLFAPSRTAFYNEATVQPKDTPDSSSSKASQLASNLEPLRAKILQAAQIQDTTGFIPKSLLPFFASIPQLLDMVIRLSPSRTPKSRTAERPWIQAVFVALADCAGCTREQPQYPDPKESINSLEQSLQVLRRHDIHIESAVLEDLFWFHSGIKYPTNGKRTMHWSLVAALVELDADMFVSSPVKNAALSEDRLADPAKTLFDHISALSAGELDARPYNGSRSGNDRNEQSVSVREVAIERTIIPILSAFARNRDLLGFIRRWDEQLCNSAPTTIEALRAPNKSIWADESLGPALASVFEQSLTLTQIKTLLEDHKDRVDSLEKTGNTSLKHDSWKKLHSTTVILRFILTSIESDETVEAMTIYWSGFLGSMGAWVRQELYRPCIDLASCWSTLCRLVTILWPLSFHGSSVLQRSVVMPLLEQATKDATGSDEASGKALMDSRVRAAALLFVFSACDHLQTVPEWGELLQDLMRKAMKALSSSHLDPEPAMKIVEIFCTEFPQLLECLRPRDRKKVLTRLLVTMSRLPKKATLHAVQSLSSSVSVSSLAALREEFVDVLMTAINEADDDEALRYTVENATLLVNAAAVSRERREALLDKMIELVMKNHENVEWVLSVMINLQQVPNATAKISSDGNALFNIAQSFDNVQSTSDTVIKLFQKLCQLTLGHILPNKEQAQNREYLKVLQKHIHSICKKPQRASPSKLALIRASFLVQQEEMLLSWDIYSSILQACLEDDSMSDMSVTEAFIELPVEFLSADKSTFKSIRKSLLNWTKLRDGDSRPTKDHKITYITENEAESQVRRLALSAKYQLYSDIKTFIGSAARTMQRSMVLEQQRQHQRAIFDSVRTALSPLTTSEKLALLPMLTEPGEETNEEGLYRLLHVLICTLSDTVEDAAEQKQRQLSLLPTLCDLLAKSGTTASFSAILDSIDAIIRTKPSYTNQHNIECVITILTTLASRNGPHLPSSDASAIYNCICETSRSILLLQRGRLGGRFHLLLPLLQNLLLCLFITNAGRGNAQPPWLSPSRGAEVRLSPANAAHYSRLLSTLCSPTQSSVSRAHLNRSANASTKSTLNDPVKSAREYASHFIYPLLGAFCRYQLNGRLDPHVRDKLMPGIWEVVEVAQLDRDALDAMFAGLDASTKDIWRGVWEEWGRVSGKGRG